MKQVIFAAGLALIVTYPAMAADTPEVKRVCKDVIKEGKPVKNKDGSTKQECKDVKVHKKHEGTKVPEKK